MIVASELKEEFARKYTKVITPAVVKLSKIFDLEHAITLLASFKFENGIIISSKEERAMWETHGSEDFHQFWSSVCILPQVEAALQVTADLNLLSHDICLTLRRLQRVLFDIIWQNKYNVLNQLFVDSKYNEIDQLKSGHLVSIIPVKEAKFMLDDSLYLTLDDGSKFAVKFLEWKLLALFYENESIYTDIGK